MEVAFAISQNIGMYSWCGVLMDILVCIWSTACVSSRPGQVGRADGYLLEGKELEFYLKKIKAKKGK
jgi:hypothetical protein